MTPVVEGIAKKVSVSRSQPHASTTRSCEERRKKRVKCE